MRGSLFPELYLCAFQVPAYPGYIFEGQPKRSCHSPSYHRRFTSYILLSDGKVSIVFPALKQSSRSESAYTLITKPIPAPGPTEVLVKLEGSALQPLEWRIPVIAPLFNSLKFPASAGVDGAGVVESVGSEVKRLKKGDRVLFQGWLEYDYTTFQQYALAPEIFVAKLPSSLSTLEASSIPSAVVTAAAGFSHPESAIPSPTEVGQHLKSFFDGRGGAGVKPFWEDGAEGVKAGEPILILGGSSSVGQLVIQIAKHLGYSPIITTSSLKHTDHLKSLGATHVLDRSTPDVSLVSDIQAITQNKPIELVYDAVGAITQAQIDLLAPGGAFVLADPTAGDSCSLVGQYTGSRNSVQACSRNWRVCSSVVLSRYVFTEPR
ncbi:hypothetical protein PM082_015701 [Marasmius tenuissimus]|nr:hypothetical protein PM082_015701 [Marasmius tenuissimus]